MSKNNRVSRLEALAAERPVNPVDWDAEGPFGALTRNCLELFLTREDQLDAHGHQLMMVGALALNYLMNREVSAASVDAVRQLMTDPTYRAHGWSAQKHPAAQALFETLQQGGHLRQADR